ncbi:MAG TPA: hypothetical protein V6C65_02240 [Allocoleopsis sp.]
MVAIWERFFPKQFKETKQTVEEQQPTPESLSDRLKIYREFNLEAQEERGGYGTFPAYRPSPHTRRIPRYF